MPHRKVEHLCRANLLVEGAQLELCRDDQRPSVQQLALLDGQHLQLNSVQEALRPAEGVRPGGEDQRSGAGQRCLDGDEDQSQQVLTALHRGRLPAKEEVPQEEDVQAEVADDGN